MNVNKIWPLISVSWIVLGFYRGRAQYIYKYNTDCKNYTCTKPRFMVTSCILSGLIGTAAYILPITMPFIIYKEIYRLEMNIHGMEEDINSPYYYDLFC